MSHGDAITIGQPRRFESQDWCEMLFRMYLKYRDRRGWKVDINDAPVAEVIGLDRNLTVTVRTLRYASRSRAYIVW